MKNIMVNLRDMSNILVLQSNDAQDHTAVVVANVAIGGDSIVIMTLGSVVDNPILGSGLARWIATQDEKNPNKNHEEMYKMIIKRETSIKVPIGNPTDGMTRVLRISYDEEVADATDVPTVSMPAPAPADVHTSEPAPTTAPSSIIEDAHAAETASEPAADE